MWREYRDMRNRSSHAYCVAVADDVIASIPAFLEDALYLYEQLQAKKGHKKNA